MANATSHVEKYGEKQDVLHYRKTRIIGTIKFFCDLKDGKFLYYDEESNKMIIRQLQNPSIKESSVEVVERFHIRKYYWLCCRFVSKFVVLALLIKHHNKHVYLATFKLNEYLELSEAILISKIDTKIVFSTVQVAVQVDFSGDMFYLQEKFYAGKTGASFVSEKAIMLTVKCGNDGRHIKYKRMIIGKKRPSVYLETIISAPSVNRRSFHSMFNYFFNLQSPELKNALYQNGYIYFVNVLDPGSGFMVETFMVTEGYFAKLSYVFKSINLLGITETDKPLAQQIRIESDSSVLPPSASATVIWSNFFSDSGGAYVCIQNENSLTLWKLAVSHELDEHRSDEETASLSKQTVRSTSNLHDRNFEVNERTPLLRPGKCKKLVKKPELLKWIDTGWCFTIPGLRLQNNCAIIVQKNQLLVQCSSIENSETKFYLVGFVGIKKLNN